MANIKSAKKRINITARQKQENKVVKSEIATYIKKFKAAVTGDNKEQTEMLYSKTTSLLDAAASKNIIHKSKADRQKSRLALFLNKNITE